MHMSNRILLEIVRTPSMFDEIESKTVHKVEEGDR